MSEGLQTAPEAGLERVARCLYCGTQETTHRHLDVRDYFFAADPAAFTYARCAGCASLWLEARPFGERLLAAYKTYYTHAEPDTQPSRAGLREALQSTYIRARFSRPSSVLGRAWNFAVRALLPTNEGIELQYRMAPPAPAKVLDYGCGSGEYLFCLRPLGYTLFGTEYDPKLLAALSARGIEVANVADIAERGWDATFDHITLSHVLEHVADPAALLTALFAMLRPGGSLYLVLPNGGATGLDIFGRYWRGLEAPRHFALPSRAALAEALGRAGFVIERQPIDRSARAWVWAESLAAASPEAHAALESAMFTAPAETLENAEFLTFLARSPA